MKEVVFQKELATSLRAVGCWIAKWPDLPVKDIVGRTGGALRFALPKPCDLIGCTGTGRLLAVECKLIRQRGWHSDDHVAKQVATLADLGAHGALVALALNFRFEARRPKVERINRCFLLWSPNPAWWAPGQPWTLEFVAALGQELPRVSGGWGLSASELDGVKAPGVEMAPSVTVTTPGPADVSAAFLSERDAARAALARYGQHDKGCHALLLDTAVCTCGFAAFTQSASSETVPASIP